MNIREDYLAPFTDFLFSIYTRLGLCFFLLFIGPFSLAFRCIIIVIFCLPVVRYIWCIATNQVMENNSGILVKVISPILYIIVYTHILIIYNFSLPVTLLLLLIPCIIFFAQVAFWPDVLDYKNGLLSTMCFYLLPFLFANAYLKAQINPHFIFNILGFIHDSVLRTDAQAAQAVIDLSELMRFAVNSSHTHQQPPLLDEIQQLKSLIRLYRLRFKERVFVEFTYSEAATERTLIPLVLLTLAENLFKHGNIHVKDDPAKIDINTNGRGLIIETYNLKKDGKVTPGFNKGMSNILTRLEHNYSNRFKMEHGEINGNHFFVKIKIFG